jgi:hypothetical protein
MDAAWFNGLVKASLGVQGAMMDEGLVSPPCLWVFRDGRPIAQVVLRQVAVGEDAESGIAEMAHMATAVRATEVVAVWESWDVARATGRQPDHPDPCLNILLDGDAGRRLHRFPYDALGEVEAATGKVIQTGWEWKEPLPPETDPLPPPSISAMLQFCFADPLPLPGDPVEVTDNYLRSEGYQVNLVKQQ